MAKVVVLPRGIIRRKCPGCGYLTGQVCIEFARFNINCPRCEKYKLNDFIPDDDLPPQPPKRRKKAV
jgi:endogenous inhibitor of DNA gyrase (YacG/DUF329 family)